MKFTKYVLALILCGFLLLGCGEEKGTYEKAGEKIDEKIEKVKDSAEEIKEEVKDEIGDHTDK